MSLIIENVSCAIAGKTILHDLNLLFDPGKVSVIVGPNGSGKSTLLNVITGVLPASGEVRLNGAQTSHLPAPVLAARRAVLAQTTPVAFNFQVREIVQMGLRAGIHAERGHILHEALHAVGLRGFENRYYQELSGGEQQRVHLARVLAQVWSPVVDDEPCWLLLDEPVSSLDIGHQLEIVSLAKDYASRGGGVVAVMHDLNLTAMMADYVVMMHLGHSLACGAVTDVLQDDVLSKAYGCSLRVGQVPGGGSPVFVLPQTASHALRA